MYEIKKIHPQSFANYLSIITAITTFIFGLLNFVVSISGVIKFFNPVRWQDQVISWLISVLFFYVISWVIGYLFAVIYNFIASRNRGVLINIEKIDMSEIKKVNGDGQEKGEDEGNFVV